MSPRTHAVHGIGAMMALAAAWPAAGRIEAQVPGWESGPQYASGRLWAPVVRHTVSMAARPAPQPRAVQAAVWGMVSASLDSSAREEAARPPSAPTWAGEVAGAEFGLDREWLVVAGARIPAAVLGLLPVSAGSPSPDQWEDARLLADRRADIERAAVRASYQDYYRAAIASIRERREFERMLNAAQRTLPATPGPQ